MIKHLDVVAISNVIRSCLPRLSTSIMLLGYSPVLILVITSIVTWILLRLLCELISLELLSTYSGVFLDLFEVYKVFKEAIVVKLRNLNIGTKLQLLIYMVT